MGDRVDELLEIELSNGDGVLELDILGTLRNYDGDGKENVKKKTIGLMSKTTTLHVHHAFLYISLPSLHNNDVK